MALTLTIENYTSLPDGGPLSYTVNGARGFDLGRDAYLDWTLPDPSRFISGKHCEVRYQDGDYVLYDVSRNGTFLNGSDRRMHGPHVLSTGDRILIGDYIVRVEVEGGRRSVHPPPPVAPGPYGASIWDADGAAPPASRSEIVERPRHQPQQPDFLDWAVDLPHVDRAASLSVPEPPRRSVWVDSSGPSGAWALSDPAPHPAPAAAAAEPGGSAVAAVSSALEGPFVDSARGAALPRDEQREEPRPAAPAGGADAAIAALARGAGVPVEYLTRRDSTELLEEVGATLRVTAEHMMRLLQARASVKRSIRSAEHTMIAAIDNNPFKFSPTPEDGLRIAFGPQTRSYLGGRVAVERGFQDIANHQLHVFTAMQQALQMLMEDLDPASVEAELGQDKGVSALLSSRKGRLWELYAARWRAKTQRSEDGMVGLFLQYFAECYDRLGQRAREDR